MAWRSIIIIVINSGGNQASASKRYENGGIEAAHRMKQHQRQRGGMRLGMAASVVSGEEAAA